VRNLLLLLILVPFLAVAKSGGEVNFLTWAGYISPAIIKQFEQESGIKVNLDYVDSQYALEAKIISINNDYDLTLPALAPFFMRQVQFGLFQALDHSKLKNYKYIDEKVIAFEKEANNSENYAAPFMVDTVGIGYNHKEIIEIMPNAPLDSLNMVFDPNIVKNFAKCGVEMLDSSEEIFALALIYLGLDPNSESEEDLKKAFEVLHGIRPFVNNINGTLYFNNLASGDNCLVIGYSGDIRHAKKMSEQSGNNLDIRYILPKEGSVMTLDLMAIPVSAANKENAYKFMDFLMRPEINAQIANSTGFTSPNIESYPLIHKILREDSNLYPLQHNRGESLHTLKISTSAFNRLRNRAWMKFLSDDVY
jgi:putrescine transport system substrate-binding protein